MTSAGLRPGTPDNLPLIGPAELDGLVLATGHYRNGILLAPLTADGDRRAARRRATARAGGAGPSGPIRGRARRARCGPGSRAATMIVALNGGAAELPEGARVADAVEAAGVGAATRGVAVGGRRRGRPPSRVEGDEARERSAWRWFMRSRADSASRARDAAGEPRSRRADADSSSAGAPGAPG